MKKIEEQDKLKGWEVQEDPIHFWSLLIIDGHQYNDIFIIYLFLLTSNHLVGELISLL